MIVPELVGKFEHLRSKEVDDVAHPGRATQVSHLIAIGGDDCRRSAAFDEFGDVRTVQGNDARLHRRRHGAIPQSVEEMFWDDDRHVEAVSSQPFRNPEGP